MNVSAFIARRYFSTQGSQPFSKFLTVVVCIGVGLSVAALIIVLSVMRGFNEDLEQKLLGFNSHITVHTDTQDLAEVELFVDKAANIDAIKFISNTIEGEAIVQSGFWEDSSAVGVKVRGVKDNFAQAMNSHFSFGEGMDFKSLFGGGNAILGFELAGGLGIHPDFSNELRLIYPFGDISPTGDFIPFSRKLKLIGVFNSGFFEYDTKYVLLSLQDALNLFGSMARFDIHIWAKSPSRLNNIVSSLKAVMPEGWSVSTWQVENKRLFSALRLERLGMFIILMLIIVIATFSIVGIILMRVFRKAKDIAILSAVGFGENGIRKIFIIEGAIIGLVGSISGLMLGLGTIIVLKKWPLQLPDSYYLDYLPVSINPFFIVLIMMIGIAAAVAASIYPASRAARLKTVELLRYE